MTLDIEFFMIDFYKIGRTFTGSQDMLWNLFVGFYAYIFIKKILFLSFFKIKVCFIVSKFAISISNLGLYILDFAERSNSKFIKDYGFKIAAYIFNIHKKINKNIKDNLKTAY